MIDKFKEETGASIGDSYGASEMGGGTHANLSISDLCTVKKYGAIGVPMPDTEVRIIDLESGKDAEPGKEGELWVRGPQIMQGYWPQPGAGLDADGWLHTGDLGALDAEGNLTLTGRAKDIIITSSGKNIAPVNLENALRETRWIGEAVVFGDNRPYLVALLTLDADELPALAERTGAPADAAAMAADERVRAVLQADVDAVNARFARIEQIKRFSILDRELSQEAGELTPTIKIKRAVVAERYADRLAALYAGR